MDQRTCTSLLDMQPGDQRVSSTTISLPSRNAWALVTTCCFSSSSLHLYWLHCLFFCNSDTLFTFIYTNHGEFTSFLRRRRKQRLLKIEEEERRNNTFNWKWFKVNNTLKNVYFLKQSGQNKAGGSHILYYIKHRSKSDALHSVLWKQLYFKAAILEILVLFDLDFIINHLKYWTHTII